MVCGKCAKPVKDCTCHDIDQRLLKASNSPHVLFRWCLTCNKHYDRCHCDEPLFGIRTNGRTTNAVF